MSELIYEYGGVDLAEIRNRNEVRVIESMSAILPQINGYAPMDIDIQDIYALAVSSLPPRYQQFGIEVYREPVTDDMVEEAVLKAIQTVRANPNHWTKDRHNDKK